VSLLKCRQCDKLTNSKVVDSRGDEEGSSIRRRLKCLGCGYRFTTKESFYVIEDQLAIRNIQIVDKFKTGYYSQIGLGKMFGISRHTISRIIKQHNYIERGEVSGIEKSSKEK